MKFGMIILIVISTALSSCSTTELKPQVKVEKFELANGLKVILIPNPELPIVSYYTFYDVGGRYESKGTTGATHFLEHMMFKGAKKYGPGDFDRIIDSNGGNNNAFTTNDETVYYENVPSQVLDQIIDLEADRMQNLLLEPTSFESERQVIFEERKMRYENSADGQLYLETMKKVFEGTPYGNSVIGEVEDLRDLTRDKMMEFFKTYYVPNNAIIVIAGDIDEAKTKTLIQEKFGAIPSTPNLIALKRERDRPENYVLKHQNWGKTFLIKGATEIPKLSFAFPGVRVGTRSAYVLDLLSTMLSEGGSSYLVKKYVDTKEAIFSSIDTRNTNLRHHGFVMLKAELMPGVKQEDAMGRLLKDKVHFCQEAINDRALQKTKNQILNMVIAQFKTNSGAAQMIGSSEQSEGDYKRAIEGLNIINSVTTKEIGHECEKIFSHEPVVVSIWTQNK